MRILKKLQDEFRQPFSFACNTILFIGVLLFHNPLEGVFSMSIVKKLNDKFGKSFSLSVKEDCPICGKKSFLIKSDDTFAKCFHPSCGIFIAEKNMTNPQDIEYLTMELMFRKFNEKFLSNKEGLAYKYCFEDRMITFEVLEKALIGEVCTVPLKFLYDIEAELKLVIKEITDLNSNIMGDPENSEKNKEELAELECRKDSLEKIKVFLQKIDFYQGWIVFAYTDEQHNILSFSLRKPYSKVINSVKPFAKKGVFGLSLIGDHLKSIDKGGKLLLTEGEFNCLQYYSFVERNGGGIKALPIVAFGGASTFDKTTIKGLSSSKYLCYDNDDAGKASIKKFAEEFNFFYFTVSKPHNDLDDLLKPTNANFSYDALQGLIENAEFKEMSFEKSIKLANKARDIEGAVHIKNQATMKFVVQDLKEKGEFFQSEGRYFFLKYFDNIAYDITSDAEDMGGLLIDYYEINTSEPTSKYIIVKISNVCLKFGKEVVTSTFTHYNKKDNSLLVYNFKDIVYHIKADGTRKKTKNGQKGVVFLKTKDAIPFYIDLVAKFAGNPLDSLLFNEVLAKGNYKVSEYNLSPRDNAILILYFFNTFLFMNYFETRPIACFIGDSGSGKTAICKLLYRIIYGEKFKVSSMPSTEENFNTLITNSSLNVLDNAETSPIWLMDKLAIISTGGCISQRKLFANNKKMVFPIDCMLFLTSMEPRFTRKDIAKRTLLFYFDSLKCKGYIPENRLMSKVLDKRDVLLNEIIGLHIPFILKAIEEFNEPEFVATFRMAEFDEFSTLLSKKLGISKKEHDQMFKMLDKNQRDFTKGDSHISELLRTYTSLKNTPNQKHSALEIFETLQVHYSQRGIKMAIQTDRQFIYQLTNSMESLKDDFNIEIFHERANRTKYCIKRLEGDVEVKDENQPTLPPVDKSLDLIDGFPLPPSDDKPNPLDEFLK